MKKLTSVSLICFLSAFIAFGCERNSVHAGNDNGTYQPYPAQKPTAPDEMKGELLNIDVGAKTFGMRLENGMVQTFRFDDNTAIKGVADTTMRNLVGKEGSELTVKFADDNGMKTATNVDVTQAFTAAKKTTRRSKRVY